MDITFHIRKMYMSELLSMPLSRTEDLVLEYIKIRCKSQFFLNFIPLYSKRSREYQTSNYSNTDIN